MLSTRGIVYHDDWVSVGSEYVLGYNQTQMDGGLIIRIYESDQKQRLLQTLFYPSPLCRNEKELFTNFGASQLISYRTREQGVVSPFVAESYQKSLQITLSMSGVADSVSLTGLQLLTTFSGYIPLDDEVSGQVLLPNRSFTVSVPMDIDLTESHRHAILTRARGTHDEGPGGDCRGQRVVQFRTRGLGN